MIFRLWIKISRIKETQILAGEKQHFYLIYEMEWKMVTQKLIFSHGSIKINVASVAKDTNFNEKNLGLQPS